MKFKEFLIASVINVFLAGAIVAGIMSAHQSNPDSSGVNYTQLKIYGTLATVIGKRVIVEDRYLYFLIVNTNGEQKQVLVNDTLFRSAKVGANAYLDSKGNLTSYIE